MKSEPIVPAELGSTPEGLPFSEAFGDVYQPHADAFLQARQVFLAGNGLPQRWQGRTRFVVLETGFGLGNNFLATWDAWRADPSGCERLVFVSIERHPLRRDDLAVAHARSSLPQLAQQLVDAWPPLAFGMHRLAFENGTVELLLAFGDVDAWLPELVMQVDAFFLDGFAPAKNPQMWQPRLFKALARLAAPEATAATWASATAVRQGLASAGFEVTKAPGFGGKWHNTLARYAPAFTPRHAPSRVQHVALEQHAVVVGAGLAGCATAAALARQGWQVSLVERGAAPAQATSGNPAGLFHGIVNAQDGTHARFNRAAAFRTHEIVAELLRRDTSAGSVQGLLRLEHALPDIGAMQAVLDRAGMPADFVHAVDAAQASALSGITLRSCAWHYPGGGWVRPASLTQHLLHMAGSRVELLVHKSVDRLQRDGNRWLLLDAGGQAIATSEVVVLANAGDALRLLDSPGWPITPVRGQLSMMPAPSIGALPRMPVAGAGYLLPVVDGQAIFGSTSVTGDTDSTLRPDEHALNLAQLEQLIGSKLDIDPAALQGRAGVRWVARDRLPLVGAVPDTAQRAGSRPQDQPRLVPRLPGLYVHIALASRGITWAALGGDVLAAIISGAPAPIEASLLDAVDPARFVSRSVRRGAPTSKA
jgi:tRNA 5-methylaminomethyl-2-thiouridine biosynthesis bifunctional protein